MYVDLIANFNYFTSIKSGILVLWRYDAKYYAILTEASSGAC